MSDTLDPLATCWGAAEIAKCIRRTPRQTHYLLATGQLPAKRLGRRWYASRQALEQLFQT